MYPKTYIHLKFTTLEENIIAYKRKTAAASPGDERGRKSLMTAVFSSGVSPNSPKKTLSYGQEISPSLSQDVTLYSQTVLFQLFCGLVCKLR